MTERAVPSPPPSATPSPPLPPSLLLLLLLLGLSCCASASPGVSRERLWDAPGLLQDPTLVEGGGREGELLLHSLVSVTQYPSGQEPIAVQEARVRSQGFGDGGGDVSDDIIDDVGADVSHDDVIDDVGADVSDDDVSDRSNDGETNTSGDIYPLLHQRSTTDYQGRTRGDIFKNNKILSDEGGEGSDLLSPTSIRRKATRSRGHERSPRDNSGGNWAWEKRKKSDPISTTDDKESKSEPEEIRRLSTIITAGDDGWGRTSSNRRRRQYSQLKREVKGEVSFRWGTTGEKDDSDNTQGDVLFPGASDNIPLHINRGATSSSSLGVSGSSDSRGVALGDDDRPTHLGYVDTTRRRSSLGRHRRPTSAGGLPSINPVAAPPWDTAWHPHIGTSTLPHHTYMGSWDEGGGGDLDQETSGGTATAGHNFPWGASEAVVHLPPELSHIGGNVVDNHLGDHRLPGVTSGAGCGCWDTVAATPEMECSCWNVDLLHVPSNFSTNVSRITMTNVGLRILRNDSFTRYRSTLKEIVLEKVGELETIEAGAFKGLQHLRSIYIHSAHLLRSMSNLTFNEDNTNLTSIRIANSGLEMIPTMQMAGNKNILHMIDLDNNRIRRVHRRSFVVRVEELSLNYNLIETVEKEAFAGSAIGKLSLKGNAELKNLHPEAFRGIESLRALDLSETSITSLPTLGLTDLEVLHLERTPTLKVFPSVYSFKSIQKANLTYPYHCCAFQFPEQHDPKQYQEFRRKMAEQQQCSDVTSPSSLHMYPTTRPRRHPHGTLTPTPASAPTPTTHTPGEMWGSLEMKGDGVSLYFPSDDGDPNPAAAGKGSQESHRAGDERSETPENLADGSLSHSRTRHYSHHSRHARKDTGLADETEINNNGKSLDPEPQLADGANRYRPGGGSRVGSSGGSRVGPSPADTHDEAAFTFLPASAQQQEEQQQHQRPAALIRDPVEDLIPRPDKRDPGAAGEGGRFHHESPLGFGAFNHSAVRFLPQGTTRDNSSSSYGWGDGSQVWSDHLPPIDSGDENTYGGAPLPKYEEGRINSGFHGEFPPAEDFPDDAGGHHDNPRESVGGHGGGQHADSQWIATVSSVGSKTIVVMCGNVSKDYQSVQCHPGPDAFNPCEDIMGNLALRVAVWLVVVTAVVGNLAVMIVLISSKFKMSVSKFLMVNLALADLCMGIYLLIIAAMDLHTIGVYFNYAIDWQNGPGCKVAGFLTVFASELSIFTLTVITSERWYAITYAIHLNKRLKLSMAMKIMVVGWAYSITMAALPLLGVSNYSKTSICLPMEIGDALGLAYLVALLVVNGLAFFVITACYASMYCSISRHDATAPHSDLTVAKRMALLVFTDFACWAPIAFFGLTAVAGLPLINVTRAKILLVFFYPLNSCANPYLYAILTKQYRRDLFILLARYGFCTKRAMKYKGAYSSVNNTFPHNTVVNAPTHRNSTLTQITLCDLTRASRTSQQSNNGSLLATTTAGGSQDSLQRNVSPLRTPTKPEMAAAENERLSTVPETSHSTHSEDDDPTDDLLITHRHHQPHQADDHNSSSSGSSSTNLKQQAGSPHPIKNCYTRLSVTPEQEEILRHALQESKSKSRKASKRGRSSEGVVEAENSKTIRNGNQEGLLLAGQGGTRVREGGGGERLSCSSSGHGEAIVICEVEIERARENNNSRCSPVGLRSPAGADTEEITSVV